MELSLHVDLKKYQWIQECQRRTVCAWAMGTLIAPVAADLSQTPIALGYNPLKRAEFYDKATGQIVKTHFTRLAAIDNEVFVSPDAQLQQLATRNAESSQFTLPPLLQSRLVFL